eukprot:s1228_g6.t1
MEGFRDAMESSVFFQGSAGEPPVQEAALRSDLSACNMHQSQSVPHLQISGAGSSRNEKVKPDKKQRSAMQGLAGMDVLQLILQQVSLSLEQLTSDEEPGGKSSEAQDVKAARRERKKALKAERRARRAQSPEERAAAKRKPCTLCQRPVDLLVRCRIDISQKWHMLCGRCWKKESGGVPDGDASHPHYRYGGLWKNRSAKVTTPSFSGAVKAKEDFDSAERLLQEAYKGG